MYSVEFLANGLVSIFDRRSKLRGLYRRHGEHVSGDLYIPAMDVISIIAAEAF